MKAFPRVRHFERSWESACGGLQAVLEQAVWRPTALQRHGPPSTGQQPHLSQPHQSGQQGQRAQPQPPPPPFIPTTTSRCPAPAPAGSGKISLEISGTVLKGGVQCS